MSDRAAELLAISNVMSSEGGRDFIWRCLQTTGYLYSTFDRDSLIHAYNAGKRDSGLWLEAEIKEASPDLYLKMLKEHLDG